MTRLLETIDSPKNLQQLAIRQLPQLAQEIRGELLEVISKLGGHLASSLGAVELCLALHYVFDAPTDQLVWDMGYQAYAHKMLTGRRKQIHTLKQFGGLSGFCHKDESPYDLFTTGHGGTCLSTALGLALARDQAKSQHHVAAIIGDASLGEGMALEALNHIGHVKPNLLVILNDNKMSIAQPVGGLSRCLNRMITNPLYNRLRLDLEERLTRLPKGRRLVRMGRKVEESLKGLLVPGLLFEELGLRYVGPIDGHNLNELILTLRNVKRLNGPILLHVLTLKGKGYRPAEEDPERFHKIEPFERETGHVRTQEARALGPPAPPTAGPGAPAGAGKMPGVRAKAPAAATFTEAFRDELVRLAQTNEQIIAITAAMPEGTGLATFGKQFPGRYFDVGMAEQHAMGLAAGLARAGLRPVVAIYSTFLQRAFDQILHELCLQELPVVLAIDRVGLVGEDGPTHHGVFDLAYLRALPNLTILSPKDPDELRAMLRFAIARPPGPATRLAVGGAGPPVTRAGAGGDSEGRAGDARGPVAIRYARGGIVCGQALGRCARVSLGKAELLQEGTDLAILALGSMVYPALEAAGRLRQSGIEAAVVNARFAKPLDRQLIRTLASQTNRLVTIEEGQAAGGFGSAVAEALEGLGLSTVPLCRIALGDQFVPHGTRTQLLKLCQFDPDTLARRITQWASALKVPADLPIAPAGQAGELRLLADPTG